MPSFGVMSSTSVAFPPGVAVAGAGAMVACFDPAPRNCSFGDSCANAIEENRKTRRAARMAINSSGRKGRRARLDICQSSTPPAVEQLRTQNLELRTWNLELETQHLRLGGCVQLFELQFEAKFLVLGFQFSVF